MTRVRWRSPAWLVLVVAAVVVGCESEASNTEHSIGSDKRPSSTTGLGLPSTTVVLDVLELSEADLAEILAVAVPAAIRANPDGRGEVAAIAYQIADSFGAVRGDSVIFERQPAPLPASVRSAISTAISPGSAVYAPADLTKAMLLIAEPRVVDDSVIVTYEQRCGGAPGALCGSGGAFRMERVAGVWQVVETISGWIS